MTNDSSVSLPSVRIKQITCRCCLGSGRIRKSKTRLRACVKCRGRGKILVLYLIAFPVKSGWFDLNLECEQFEEI